MLLESTLSCCYLLITCGSCIFTLRKASQDQYNRFLPHFALSCVGLSGIAARSLIVLIYKIFIKTYTFNPELIRIEEERNKLRINICDQILGTIGMATIIYSLYCHHGYYLLGGIIVGGFSCREFYKIHQYTKSHPQVQVADIPNTSVTSIEVESGNQYHGGSCWILVNGYFAYRVGNNYGLLANYPYLVAIWALPTEAFYQGWNIRRTINDYTMMIYVLLMTEALRQTTFYCYKTTLTVGGSGT